MLRALFLLGALTLGAAAQPAHAQFVIERVMRLPRLSSYSTGPVASGITPFADAIYFVVNARELWRTDGTEGGSELVRAFASVDVKAATDTHLLLHAAETGGKTELWSLSRLSGTFERISDVLMESLPVRVGGVVYYVARTPEHGRELWRSNGTAVGTAMVLDVNAGPEDGEVGEFVPFRDGLFFSALHRNQPTNTLDDERYLYYTEGTRTERVIGTPNAIYPALSIFMFNSVAVYDDRLFFAYSDAAHGRELWVSDGTPQGTRMHRDLNPGSASSDPHDFAPRGDQLLFFAYPRSGSQHSQLWAYGGGQDTLRLGAVDATRLYVAGPTAYFINTSWTSARGLWVSNGTPEGTHLVSSALTGAEQFHALNDTVLFMGRTSAQGKELWMTDGSGAATHLVADLNPGTRSTTASPMYSDRLARGPQDGPGGVLFTAETSDGNSLIHAFPGGATRVAPEGATVAYNTVVGRLAPWQGALYFEGRFFDHDPALYRLVAPPLLPTTSEAGAPVPEAFVLGASFPNPVRTEAHVPFTLAAPGRARLTLYDALGRAVYALAERAYPAGSHTLRLPLGGLAPGVYPYTLTVGALSETRALVVAP